MGKPNIIAIDGPAASGKTTLARRLAKALGYTYFDTGMLYRVVTLVALERGEDIQDAERMTALAQNLDVELRPDPETGGTRIHLRDRDVTERLYTPEVDAHVSIVAAHPGVRKALAAVQRRLALRGRIVVVGRDIGTVIVPEADCKIYLDASPEVRALRRYREALAKGFSVTFEQVLEDIRRRDRLDASRAVAPLRPAADAFILNTDNLNPDEVFRRILEYLEAHNDPGPTSSPEGGNTYAPLSRTV